jgi:hypothetical protein
MAMSGRHVPAGHHRGGDGDAHGGAGGERAAGGGAGSTGRRAAGGPLADRESALPPSRARHARRLRSPEANQAVPALTQLLGDHNAGLPATGRQQRQLRVRVVVHAGEVHYDANGCFAEALDIAFRLLDAPSVKKALAASAGPLTLVISDDIYRTVVRHHYDGIDQLAFRPLVRVNVAGQRHTGWIHLPDLMTTPPHVAQIARYRQSA